MHEQTFKKRCVCGQSMAMPLCDGKHRTEGWNCGEMTTELVPIAFVASANLRNLADRLAHRFNGVSLNAVDGDIRSERLVILADGHNLERLTQRSERCQAREQTLIGVGVNPRVLQWAFPRAGFLRVSDHPIESLWHVVESAVLTKPEPTLPIARPSVFLSHSAEDEGALYPVLNVLREQLRVKVFLCADSIPAGAVWRQEIRKHLDSCDLFLYIASERSNGSVYCSFEAGMAAALGKRIRVVSLDGSPPPAHLADIQATAVPRLMQRKPWLSRSDAILEATLEAIS
jgi:hypothetical protein